MSETYYGRFYGFESPPFHITPDPSVLFATSTHQQALGAIEYGITAGKGFIVVTGQVGVGKTTVLRFCLDRLDSSKTKIIYLFSPALSAGELYATILQDLDVPMRRRKTEVHTLGLLHRALLATHKAGLQIILAVDEAQNMPEETLESLRILSNFETAKSKLLQIILVGQPELDAILAKHSLRQLAQRVAVRARIRPLTWLQSCRYIQHRCQFAGRAGNKPLFTIPAMWYLAVTARGNPRTINICCDNALINGYGYTAERISLKIAYRSCRALKFRAPFRRASVLSAAAAVLICIVFSGDIFLRHFLDAAPLRQTMTIAEPQPPANPSAPPPVTLDPNPVTVTSPGTEIAVLPPAAAEAAGGLAPPAEVVPAATPARIADDTPIAEPADRGAPQLVWRRYVRKGDTLYRVCLEAYGQCDQGAMRAVFAANPQIRSSGLIRQGEVIYMPERVGSAHSN